MLKVRDLTVLTYYFVMAEGTSTTQVKSLAEDIEFYLEQEGVPSFAYRGYVRKTGFCLITVNNGAYFLSTGTRVDSFGALVGRR